MFRARNPTQVASVTVRIIHTFQKLTFSQRPNRGRTVRAVATQIFREDQVKTNFIAVLHFKAHSAHNNIDSNSLLACRTCREARRSSAEMPLGCDRERKGGWPGDSELRKRDQVEAGGTKKIIGKIQNVFVAEGL